MADTKTAKRKLTITGHEEIASWKDKDDNDVIIYKVQAVDEHGEKVNAPLRTFHADLPFGELIEFDVSPYDHEKYGLTYTLKLPSKGRASKKDVTDLKQQVSDLAGRVGALEQEVARLKPETPEQKRASEKFGSDDDIPF